MSGLEEVEYAPECPFCGNCIEWYMGVGMWLYTRKMAIEKGMITPLLVHRVDGPDETYLGNVYRCVGCLNYIDDKSLIGKRLKDLFLRQRGRFYHNLDGMKRWEL